MTGYKRPTSPEMTMKTEINLIADYESVIEIDRFVTYRWLKMQICSLNI